MPSILKTIISTLWGWLNSFIIDRIKKIKFKDIKPVLYYAIWTFLLLFCLIAYDSYISPMIRHKEHRERMINSNHMYSNIKPILRQSLAKTNSEYIFLIEYHNGASNYVTNIPFVKFDVRMEVANDTVPYLNMDGYQDNNVCSYDVLIDEELNNNDILLLNKHAFNRYRKIGDRLHRIGAEQFLIINLKDRDNYIFASMVFISLNDNINIMQSQICTNKIREIFLKKK